MTTDFSVHITIAWLQSINSLRITTVA